MACQSPWRPSITARVLETCGSLRNSLNGKTRLRHVWSDELDGDPPLEFHLVRPTPPRLAHDVVGHIVIVQRPREDWVTSLVTLIDFTLEESRGQLQRMAVTTP